MKLACELPDKADRSLSPGTCRQLAIKLTADGTVDSISAQSVQRVVDSSQLKPWRVHYGLSPKVTRDEAFRERVLDIMGLYTRELGADEVACSLDEKTSLQPRTRSHETNPPRAGNPPALLEHEDARKGALHLFAAFHLRSGDVVGVLRRRKRPVELLERLEAIDTKHPASIRVIHRVCGNVSVHHGKWVRAWLARHPRFQRHFTPVHCPWRNPVEPWFSILHRRCLTAPNFDDLQDLERKSLEFILQCNVQAHPFRWSKRSFDKVLAKVDAQRAIAA